MNKAKEWRVYLFDVCTEVLCDSGRACRHDGWTHGDG